MHSVGNHVSWRSRDLMSLLLSLQSIFREHYHLVAVVSPVSNWDFVSTSHTGVLLGFPLFDGVSL